MLTTQKQPNILGIKIALIAVMVFLMFPANMLATSSYNINNVTPQLKDYIAGNTGRLVSGMVENTAASGSQSSADNQAYVLQQALEGNNANAQRLINLQPATQTPSQLAQNAMIEAATGKMVDANGNIVDQSFAGQQYAQNKIDATQASGIQSKLTDAQSQMFASAAVKDNNAWAQQKVLDSIRRGDVSPEDIQKLKDAAEKNGLSDFKKKIEDAEKNKNPNSAQPPKANKDKCVLITPGMSKTNGELYGEPLVKAFNDKNDYMPVVVARCGILAHAEIFTPKYKDINTSYMEPCAWALDYSGYSKKTPATKTESELNFKIRTIQTTENVDKYAVTMNADLEAITPTGANEEIRQGAKYAGQSNEQINEENAKLGGGTVTKVPPTGPTKAQHEEYYNSPQNERGYTVGSGNKKMFAGAPFTAGDKAASIEGKKANKQDVQVTKECDFQDNKQQGPQPPSPGAGWPGNGGSNNGGGGGGGDGGGGGGLGKMLPALMQMLQMLKGGNQGNQPPTPYGATPTPYVCPSSQASDSVCGVNGVTYASRCVAEYENRVTVKHTGVCTIDDITSTSSASVTTLTNLLQQLTASGLPDSLINSVTNIVTNLITSILTNGSSVSRTIVQ